MSYAVKLSIKEAKSLLSTIVDRNIRLGNKSAHYSKYIPVMFRSEPGVGKTSITAQVAAEKDLGFYLLQASVREASDLSGIPDAVDVTLKTAGRDRTIRAAKWLAPDFFLQPNNTLFMLDEITKAPHMMGAVSMLAYERRVGEHLVPDGSTLVFAGNREEDNAGDFPLPSQLADRLCIVEVYSTFKHFLEHASGIGMSTMITGYVSHHGQKAFSFNPKSERNPTYRSWGQVDNVLDLGLTGTQLHAAVSAYVGDQAAQQFMQYLKWNEEFEAPEYIIANPELAKVPSGSDSVGKCYSIVSALIGHASVRTIGPIMRYMSRLGHQEIIVYAIRDIMMRDPKVAAAPEVKKWKLDNNRLFTPVV